MRATHIEDACAKSINSPGELAPGDSQEKTHNHLFRRSKKCTRGRPFFSLSSLSSSVKEEEEKTWNVFLSPIPFCTPALGPCAPSMNNSSPTMSLTCFVGALEKDRSRSAMSSSSEGGTGTYGFRCCCFVVVVIAVAATAPADLLRASLPSLIATRLHGVAEPDDKPRVLLPVVAKPSIWGGARGPRKMCLGLFFCFESRHFSSLFSAPPALAGAGLGGGQASRVARETRKERALFSVLGEVDARADCLRPEWGVVVNGERMTKVSFFSPPLLAKHPLFLPLCPQSHAQSSWLPRFS
jgi:hypothetical protein